MSHVLVHCGHAQRAVHALGRFGVEARVGRPDILYNLVYPDTHACA